MHNNLFDDESLEVLGAAIATKGASLYKVAWLTADSYEFQFSYLRNTDTIVRIGGAPPKIDLAGVSDSPPAATPAARPIGPATSNPATPTAAVAA